MISSSGWGELSKFLLAEMQLLMQIKGSWLSQIVEQHCTCITLQLAELFANFVERH